LTTSVRLCTPNLWGFYSGEVQAKLLGLVSRAGDPPDYGVVLAEVGTKAGLTKAQGQQAAMMAW
jgi:hypothetical protein